MGRRKNGERKTQTSEFRVLGHFVQHEMGECRSARRRKCRAPISRGGETRRFSNAKVYLGKIKCQRVIDRVLSVFCSGCETWSGSRATMDRISRMGNADLTNIIEQGGGRNDTKLLLEDTPGGKKYLETEMRLPFLTA